MKIVISVLGIAVLAAVLLLWNRMDDDQGARQANVSTQRAPEPITPEPITSNGSSPGDHARARPQVPTLPAPEWRAEKPVRVEIDRRPRDPARESEGQYKQRARFIAAFDRFREDSGISDEKAQAVLALLYDYQETSRYVRKQDLDRILSDDNWKPTDYESNKALHTSLLIKLDAGDALEELLTPEEMRPWRRHMERIAVWGQLNWPYEPPLIIPADDDAAS